MKADTVISVAKIIGVAVVAYAGYRAVTKGVKTIDSITTALGETVNAVVETVQHPLDFSADLFGIVPRTDKRGRTTWVPTVPWENPNDPVSNNSSGVNWNYF